MMENADEWTRYSGDAVIGIVVHETAYGAKYTCSVRGPNAEKALVQVGSPAVLTVAIDSEEAIDDAARAAIAFAQDEDGGFECVAYERDLSAVWVGRTMEDAWPPE